MSSLMSIAPQKAIIAETGEEVDTDEVKLNTILAVKAGEIIPIDGIVVDGNCEVDEKTLNGESFPVPKQKVITYTFCSLLLDNIKLLQPDNISKFQVTLVLKLLL
ncbi:hypothetical protein MANES_13G076550v8 [Manihot esculenta]|uniref:Uncharacterized protein n=1 Tax=Manihot esculenta TaxID=3983 RepID=A0ACB7GK50_MANES|nr:hypothetical protein MANES_13G076550v8 [Manihot esculenta]